MLRPQKRNSVVSFKETLLNFGLSTPLYYTLLFCNALYGTVLFNTNVYLERVNLHPSVNTGTTSGLVVGGRGNYKWGEYQPGDLALAKEEEKGRGIITMGLNSYFYIPYFAFNTFCYL